MLYMTAVYSLDDLSTHDLTWRSTQEHEKPSTRSLLSTHDLTWRSTINTITPVNFTRPFNSRPHMEVDNQHHYAGQFHETFQLTTSHGGRHFFVQLIIALVTLSTHDLTWRSTLEQHADRGGADHFQLTTSHGGRQGGSGPQVPRAVPFNSRPHMEVDRFFVRFLLAEDLSTHDLTWRSTRIVLIVATEITTFNSRPHMEVDIIF